MKRDRQMTKVGKMLIGDLFVMSANISNNVTEGFIMGLPPFHMDTFFIITKTIKKENYFWRARTLRKPLLVKKHKIRVIESTST